MTTTSRARDRRPRTVAAIYALKLLYGAAAAGVDVQRLPPLPVDPQHVDGVEARIPYEALIRTWEALMAATGDPGLPIAVASRAELRDYNAIGFACMTRANLGEALHQ